MIHKRPWLHAGGKGDGREAWILGQCLFKLCRRFLLTMDLVAEIDPLALKTLSYLVFW